DDPRAGRRRRGLPRRVERSPGSAGARGSHPRDARGADRRRAARRGRRRRARDASRHRRGDARDGGVRRLWQVRELSTLVILALEVAFFGWYLWPAPGRPHPFLNADNGLLILKYSSIYGIAAIGAAVVIIAGGIDLAPGAVIALAGVVTG